MFGNIGTVEILIVAGIILLFFGGKKLVEFARGLGEATKELKKVGKDLQEETN